MMGGGYCKKWSIYVLLLFVAIAIVASCFRVSGGEIGFASPHSSTYVHTYAVTKSYKKPLVATIGMTPELPKVRLHQ